MSSSLTASQRVLVTTTTGEPMQPVRLYYTLAAARRPAIVRILESLRCCGRAPSGPRWGWWHRNEAARLDFSDYAANARPMADPVILGIIDLPTAGGMTITVRSYHRAVLAARFFARRLGDRVSLTRARVLNRFLAGDEVSSADGVDGLLDEDVVVIDPAVAEAAWEKAITSHRHSGQASPPDLEAIYADVDAQMQATRPDVPTVEDFPLYPDEESPTFGSLKLALDLRFVRAQAHWTGRTEVTLRAVIREMAARVSASSPP